ncbi:hypothetical protein LEP1GSC173_1777 [Leptospira interrogans str. HAI1594]|nr:hypothetical protein LEP1GSC117_3258 [Leptospira interrogans serovar Icterohaemorrhagiae str. Verdun LP]EKP75556.1 hypothetical protein LEP1GSC173_1777 [Leptospira interrogans str. HAI1594]EMO19714.1 hypothetical protein LEP1GSC167_2149 [Leptospira interrogans serovar Copenhageni str. HAI0188]EMO38373.1 hypothetical protein LEP1GSC177_2268 [Leptospira interrogans str. MMD3731]EMY55131.1 hypothetical protein LEP1GSC204_1074 [Leptospira interrogans serovar Copenhageni str. M20]
MMVAKQRFCVKNSLDGDFFVFYSSSHNFQSLTINLRFVRIPTSIFYEKIDLR